MILVVRMMSKYWQKREVEQRLRFQSKTEKEINEELVKLYRAAADKVIEDMELIYPSLLTDDALANYYYRYKRYYQLREKINKKLSSLGKKELKVLDKKFEIMYKYSSWKTLEGLNFSVDNKMELEKVIQSLWDNRTSWRETVWCKDGLTGAQRVEKTMARLQNKIEKGMSDCVLRGASKDELVKELKSTFGVSFSEADRIARTELTYIQNQATRDSYLKAGVTQYEYLAEIDGKTSDVCAELNGQRFDIAAAVVGVNYPPLHPNCRSTVLAVID